MITWCSDGERSATASSLGSSGSESVTPSSWRVVRDTESSVAATGWPATN